MLKDERQKLILKELNNSGLIKVSDISNKLSVTEMTIRRDLVELEDRGFLKRVYGGARTTNFLQEKEFSHDEKRKKDIEEKKYIAQKIYNTIHENEIVFLGTGSTIELVGDIIDDKKFKIVTNSLTLFNKIKDKNNINSILIGGSYRRNTGAFVGTFSINIVKKFRFKRAFAGTNGIKNNDIYTYNDEEGEVQKIALDNSIYKYIVADSSKMRKQDFLAYYKTENLTAIITDNKVSKSDISMIKSYTDIIY